LLKIFVQNIGEKRQKPSISSRILEGISWSRILWNGYSGKIW